MCSLSLPAPRCARSARRLHSSLMSIFPFCYSVRAAPANKCLPEDLYYRLNAFTLSLPPLRDRKEEIPILLKHSMSQMAERYARPPLPLSPALLQACHNHTWPGNLRELNNFLKRYLILG